MYVYFNSIASRIPLGQTCASCFVYELLVLGIYVISWVKVCSGNDLGDPWGGPGLAGVSIWGSLGGPWGSLGNPGRTLGVPWHPSSVYW